MAPFHPAATFINSSICNCSRFDPWLSILLFCFNQFSQNQLNIRNQIQFDFDFFARQDVFCDLQTTLLKLPYLQNVPTHLTWNHLPTPHMLWSRLTSFRSCRSTQKHIKTVKTRDAPIMSCLIPTLRKCYTYSASGWRQASKISRLHFNNVASAPGRIQ